MLASFRYYGEKHVNSVKCSRKKRHIIKYSAASCTLLACSLSVVTGEYCHDKGHRFVPVQCLSIVLSLSISFDHK